MRYFEKEHIRDLIPKTHLGILAEFEYLLNEWKIKQGFIKDPTIIPHVMQTKAEIPNKDKPLMIGKRTQTDALATQAIGVNTLPMELQENSTSNMVFNEDSELLTVLSYADNSMSNTTMNNTTLQNNSPVSFAASKEKYDYDPFGDSFVSFFKSYFIHSLDKY